MVIIPELWNAVPKELSERPLHLLPYRIVEDVRISLCCSDVAVPEDLLDGGDGNSPVYEDRGACHPSAVE